MKRFVTLLLVIAIVAGVYYFVRAPQSPRVASTEGIASATGGSDSSQGARSAPEITALNLASELNAPGKAIHDDLKLIDSVFSVWQTNFLHTGNPVGTNAEITAALTGKNTLNVAFISPRNPAINRSGELCDRWGTPFFFHQLSGTEMEIRSAGPDKIRGTADDAAITP